MPHDFGVGKGEPQRFSLKLPDAAGLLQAFSGSLHSDSVRVAPSSSVEMTVGEGVGIGGIAVIARNRT